MHNEGGPRIIFGRNDAQLERIENQLAHIHRMLVAVLENQNLGAERMSDLSDRIAKIQADVTAENTVIDSVEALLAGLKTSLDDALAKLAAAGVSPADLQALTDLSATVEAKTSELAAAVAANTPPPAPTP